MIEVKDRIPTYPGRVKLVPVPGQPNTYDMVRADEPSELGTPINRALFESIRSDVTVLQHNVSDLMASHAQKTTLGSVPPGAEFVLFEDGIRVPFIKLAGEYGSTGRNLVIRKNIYKMDSLVASGSASTYMNSKTDLWLNDETDGYVAKFDSLTKAALAEVPVELYVGDAVTVMATLSRKAFLLSATEYGIVNAYTFMTEGIKVEYFNSASRKISQFNGAIENHWMRSRQRDVTGSTGYISTTGAFGTYGPSGGIYGIRPALTLPATFEIDLSVPDTGNTVAAAEVI